LSWRVETLNKIVEKEVGALPEDGKLRMKEKSGISGALYVTTVGQHVVILRVEKTPRHEMDLALSRAKLIKTTEK
jgi:phage-related protein